MASCSGGRAGTLVYSHPAVGASFNEASYPDVWVLRAIAVGARGGNVTLADGTVVQGGLGCAVSVSYTAFGGTAQSLLGAAGTDTVSSTGGSGGTGWRAGGPGGPGSSTGGTRSGAGGGGATGVFRSGVTLAIAAGGGGASVRGAGGSACGTGSQNGASGVGTSPGGGATSSVSGTGGNVGSGFAGSAGTCPSSVFSTGSDFVAPQAGGAGGFNIMVVGANGGGGGGGGSCGGGGGAPDLSGSASASGGGAGSSYAFTNCSSSTPCAAPTYASTTAAPGVTFQWISMAPLGDQRIAAGALVSLSYTATFGDLGVVNSGINGDYMIVSGSLPTGLTLDPTTGVISGRAYLGSYSPFTLQASIRTADGRYVAMSRHTYWIGVYDPRPSEFNP